MGERRVFWPFDDLPDGPIVIWRGSRNRGVREVRYVPCDDAAVERARLAMQDEVARTAHVDYAKLAEIAFRAAGGTP